jgi:hypothetical protein
MGRNKDIDAWFSRSDNPRKDVMLRVRSIILGADSRIDECIKWQTPTFSYRGNLASFTPRSKQHASLLFHTGANIPGTHNLLEGTGSTARVMTIPSGADAIAAEPDIERIVRAWCDRRDSEQSAHAQRTAPVTKTRKKRPGPR